VLGVVEEAQPVADEPSSLESEEKTLDRQIRAFHWVRLLAELPGRAAGSALEREAAERVEAWMREIGFDEVERSPVPSRPSPGAVLALHLGLGALGCWIGGIPGLLLAGLALLSFQREQRRGVRGLSALLGARDSLNVAARAGVARPRRRIVLTAHIDATRAGRIFSRRFVERFAPYLLRRAGAKPARGPFALPERLLWAAGLIAAASALGAEGWLFGLARLAVGGLLAFGVFAMLEWALAPFTPGANDNASGVAAMLTCAEQLLARLPSDAELWVVGTGAEEVGYCGMRALLDAHPDWRADQTCFVNFECVGGGSLHWLHSEGTLTRVTYPPTLTELARRLAHDGAFGEVTSVHLMAGTDGSVPAARELHTLTLVALEADGIPRNYHRVEDVAEALDMACVIRAADFAVAVAVAWLRGEADPLAIV
jgi:hypothetical protein